MFPLLVEEQNQQPILPRNENVKLKYLHLSQQKNEPLLIKVFLLLYMEQVAAYNLLSHVGGPRSSLPGDVALAEDVHLEGCASALGWYTYRLFGIVHREGCTSISLSWMVHIRSPRQELSVLGLCI